MLSPKQSATDCASLHADWPLRLAEVETIACPQVWQRFAAVLCRVTRVAMVSRLPVSSVVDVSLALSIQVIGPGHVAASCFSNNSSTTAMYGSSWLRQAAIIISPLLLSRCFKFIKRSSVILFSGSQPRPNTPSVGYATIPPCWIHTAALFMLLPLCMDFLYGVCAWYLMWSLVQRSKLLFRFYVFATGDDGNFAI